MRDKMVYNEEDISVATPPADFVKINILLKKQRIMDALDHYYEFKGMGAHPELYKLRSKIHVLYLDLLPALTRWIKPADEERESVEEIKKLINSKKFEEVERGFIEINFWLDAKKITRVDNRKDFDRTNPEHENEHDTN